MLWIKAFHIIAVVIWFGGLFYLPRLFVYHASCQNEQAKQHFSQMETNLYRVMSAAALFTLFLGALLVAENAGNALYGHWLALKLALVFPLVIYHFYLGHLRKAFIHHRNRHGEVFYRWLNEVPTVFLVGIILIVVIKPWS